MAACILDGYFHYFDILLGPEHNINTFAPPAVLDGNDGLEVEVEVEERVIVVQGFWRFEEADKLFVSGGGLEDFALDEEGGVVLEEQSEL
jgi:hypothetical protein